MNQTIYKNALAGQEYRVMTEDFGDYSHYDEIKELVTKYPTIRNVSYGWGKTANTDKPDFNVKYPLKVLLDVWNNINLLDSGTYMFAADNQRILNIYYKRWLANPKWMFLERGVLMDCPYVILRKIKFPIDN